MKVSLSFLSVIAMAVFLTGCAVSSQDGVMETETRSSGFMGLSTNDAVEVSSEKAFSGTKQVVIGSFKVGFNDSKKLQKKASGGFMSGGFGGKSTGLVKLEGISPSVMQDITNQAYVDFVQDLKSKGFDVVNRSNFTSSEAYDGIKEYDFPYTDDNSGFLSAYGTATYYSPVAIGSKQPIFFNEIEGVTGGIGFSNPAIGASEYSKQTGVNVLNVTYFVDFAGAGGSETMFTSRVSVGQLLSVDKGVLGIASSKSSAFSSGTGSLTLGQPIGSKISFATIEQTSSTAAVGLETTVNIASALLGSGTNHSREFVFNANPSQYKKASLEVLTKANDTFIDTMVSLR